MQDLGMTLVLPRVSNISIRFRSKSRESALNKLYYYVQVGRLKFPLYRIINDLMGFRIIVNDDTIKNTLTREYACSICPSSIYRRCILNLAQ